MGGSIMRPVKTHNQLSLLAFAVSPRKRTWEDGVTWENGVRKCAGINRHAVEDERALQERSSEPPGLESCGGSREAAVEA